jgi:hypothetical protein
MTSIGFVANVAIIPAIIPPINACVYILYSLNSRFIPL